MFSYEAPPLDLEIVESPSRIFRWGHQMVSGINGLVTLGEYNFILVDPLFVYTCRQLWLGGPGIIVGCSVIIRSFVMAFVNHLKHHRLPKLIPLCELGDTSVTGKGISKVVGKVICILLMYIKSVCKVIRFPLKRLSLCQNIGISQRELGPQKRLSRRLY
jgi:hypothetical protein